MLSLALKLPLDEEESTLFRTTAIQSMVDLVDCNWDKHHSDLWNLSANFPGTNIWIQTNEQCRIVAI